MCEMTHATGNIYKDWWGQQSAKKASNQQKYIPSYSPGYGEL